MNPASLVSLAKEGSQAQVRMERGDNLDSLDSQDSREATIVEVPAPVTTVAEEEEARAGPTAETEEVQVVEGVVEMVVEVAVEMEEAVAAEVAVEVEEVAAAEVTEVRLTAVPAANKLVLSSDPETSPSPSQRTILLATSLPSVGLLIPPPFMLSTRPRPTTTFIPLAPASVQEPLSSMVSRARVSQAISSLINVAVDRLYTDFSIAKNQITSIRHPRRRGPAPRKMVGLTRA